MNDGNIVSMLLTRPVFVNISHTPVVIQQQPPAFLEIKEGEELTISCLAQSYPKPHYQWFKDNTKLEGETSNVLHVRVIVYVLNIDNGRKNISHKKKK
jgi:hypothetical protein